mgnify:CR=1 FL=1
MPHLPHLPSAAEIRAHVLQVYADSPSTDDIVARVRQMIADRELETWLVVDMSASLDFGTTGCEKRDLAVGAAEMLAAGVASQRQALAATGDRGLPG